MMQQEITRLDLSCKLFGGQITGLRESQQDAFRLLTLTSDKTSAETHLALVADGMGGHLGGEKASQIVADTFVDGFKAAEEGTAKGLEQSLILANKKIADMQQSNPHYKDMGTTLVALLVIGDQLYWISVGDSPLWLFRKDRLNRLNQDHSMLPVLLKMVEMGELSTQEALKDPKRHVLRSAIKGETLKLIDKNAQPVELKAGDILLAATDGIETLEESQITDFLKQNKDSISQQTIEKLLNQVIEKAKPEQDNTTLVMVSVSEQHLKGSSNKKTLLGKLSEQINKILAKNINQD